MMRAHRRWLWTAPALGLTIGCATLDSAKDAAPLIRAQSSERGMPAITIPHVPQAETAPAVLSVSLEAVLQLAECQNPSLAVARERVKQAYAEEELAAKSWIPEVTVGAGYYRHEGGIQLQEGPLIRSSTGAAIAGLDASARIDPRSVIFAKLDAARKLKQQQGELHKLTTDVLLDAAGAYVDLLTAHSGLAVARELQADLGSLRDRVNKLASLEQAAKVEAARVESEYEASAQMIRKLEGQARNAAAKLAYLLGLDPCTELAPADPKLVAFVLADADQPACDLVAQALACGPGVKELEAILCIVERGIAEASGPSRFLPTFTAQALEGGFWAGPNDRLDSANRFDLGVQARWNVTELYTADIRKRITSSLQAQAQMTYCDVRGKLTLGVQEARETILSSREQLKHAESQVREAKSALDLSESRLREGIQGASYGEVLLAYRSYASARATYLQILQDYDKAQLRLMVLTGCCRR